MIWTMVEWLLLLGISKKVPISLLESRLIQRDSPPIPPSLQLSKQILQIGKTSWESDTNHMTYHINTMQLIEAHNRHFILPDLILSKGTARPRLLSASNVQSVERPHLVNHLTVENQNQCWLSKTCWTLAKIRFVTTFNQHFIIYMPY